MTRRHVAGVFALALASTAGAQPVSVVPDPPPGKIRWGEELPPIERLMQMPKDELMRELERATSASVTASWRTAAQATVLRALATKDPRVAPALAPFPVRVEVVPQDGVAPETAARYEVELVRVLNELRLPAVRGDAPHAGRLVVDFEIVENERTPSILAGTKMRSYAVRLAGRLLRPDGTQVLEYGSVRSALGLNVQGAVARDFDRNAASQSSELVDQLARYALSLP